MSDAHSIQQAQSGDAAALDRVLEGLAVYLLPLASALCRGSAEDARALMQDTLIRTYERLGQLRDPGALHAWARTTMVRLLASGHRARTRLREDPLEVVVETVPATHSADLLDLRAAVGVLGTQERALLVLHYWLGLSLAECAAELGVPDGTAKSRLHATLQRLRARLDGGRDA